MELTTIPIFQHSLGKDVNKTPCPPFVKGGGGIIPKAKPFERRGSKGRIRMNARGRSNGRMNFWYVRTFCIYVAKVPVRKGVRDWESKMEY